MSLSSLFLKDFVNVDCASTMSAGSWFHAFTILCEKMSYCLGFCAFNLQLTFCPLLVVSWLLTNNWLDWLTGSTSSFPNSSLKVSIRSPRCMSSPVERTELNKLTEHSWTAECGGGSPPHSAAQECPVSPQSHSSPASEALNQLCCPALHCFQHPPNVLCVHSHGLETMFLPTVLHL